MKRWMMVLIVGLLVFSLACSVLDRGSKPTTEPGATTGPGATAESQTPETATDDSTPPEVASDALQRLSSYRSKTTIRSEFDDGELQEVTLIQEYIREPFATRMVMESVGDEENSFGEIEMIQVGGTQWINFGGSWMQTEATEDGDFEDTMISYGDISGGLTKDDYEYLGRETINGIKTKHYRLRLNPLQMGMFGTNAEEASSEVWIADESGLPAFTVRMVITFKGDVEEGRPGTSTIMQDVYDVNKNFTIEPPEAALSGGLPADVPLYPGATGLSSMMGFVTFNAPDDVETVKGFYNDALADNGWETDGDEFMPTWTKGERSLQIFISEADGGGSSVTIMIQAEE